MRLRIRWSSHPPLMCLHRLQPVKMGPKEGPLQSRLTRLQQNPMSPRTAEVTLPLEKQRGLCKQGSCRSRIIGLTGCQRQNLRLLPLLWHRLHRRTAMAPRRQEAAQAPPARSCYKTNLFRVPRLNPWKRHQLHPRVHVLWRSTRSSTPRSWTWWTAPSPSSLAERKCFSRSSPKSMVSPFRSAEPVTGDGTAGGSRQGRGGCLGVARCERRLLLGCCSVQGRTVNI
mmetsp:Transcript_31971/g.92871  ORF Transcript_31971/g.92871 Transcript_31971/m.92871 type:complete len:227 (+) Transcript_31971:64-744(+)